VRSAVSRWLGLIGFGVVALVLSGCGTLSGGLHADLALTAPPSAVERDTPSSQEAPAIGTDAAMDVAADLDVASVAVVAAAAADSAAVEPAEADALPEAAAVTAASDDQMVAQAGARQGSQGPALEPELEEFDPWEKFNEVMFEVNRTLDRYIFKPVAQAYNFVVPDEVQRMVENAFDHINVVPRFVNSLLQGKWAGAGREVARFLINSVVGIGGFWDIAKTEFNILPSKEDFGQTLGFYGGQPGPYLILPLMPPLTVRDGIGKFVDGLMDPLSYVLPFIWERLVMKVIETVNDRSLNLELFEGVEATTVDLYSAVRNAYLQRRARQIRE
jgi:phospholipid-binding lipoprotein MlaA